MGEKDKEGMEGNGKIGGKKTGKIEKKWRKWGRKWEENGKNW